MSTINLLIGTNNSHKVIEFNRLLGSAMFSLTTPSRLGLAIEVQETGSSYADNAILKAQAFSQMSGFPVIADDSGIEVNALGGKPGIYSARYGGSDLSDSGRLHLLLEEMKAIPDGERECKFVAAIAVCWPGCQAEIFEATCIGNLAKFPSGANGFGYDPIFIPEGSTKTMAQFSDKEKDIISHRGKAVRLFLEKFNDKATLKYEN